MTTHSHNRLLGILLVIHGLLNSALAVKIYFVMNDIPISEDSKSDPIFLIFITTATVALLFTFLLFVLQTVSGIKVMRRVGRGRNWGIFGSIAACLSGPLGLALGIYGLWFFFDERGKDLYELK